MLAAPTGSRSIVVGLAIVILIGVAVAAYAPGLDGLFVFDSVERVIRNESLQMSSPDTEQFLAAAYAAQADYPQRGLAYVTLALNYYFAGQQFGPFAFKATNLAIHILNGLLVLILAKLILSRWWQLGVLKSRQDPSFRIVVLAIVAMGLWLLHPIQLNSRSCLAASVYVLFWDSCASKALFCCRLTLPSSSCFCSTGEHSRLRASAHWPCISGSP
jgi:hypothetical protein